MIDLMSGGWFPITDNACDLVLRRESYGLKEYIHFDKQNVTAEFHQEKFYLHGGELTPQQAEERKNDSEFVQFSCKYGSWHYEEMAVNKADLKMALDILDTMGEPKRNCRAVEARTAEE